MAGGDPWARGGRAVLVTTELGTAAAAEEVRRLLPVVQFLSAILVVATLCAAEGVFVPLGAVLSRLARRSPVPRRRTMLRHGERPSAVDFHRMSLLVTPPAVTACVVTLWAWSRLLGTS